MRTFPGTETGMQAAATDMWREPARQVRIGHVQFDAVTQRGALEVVERLIETGQGGYVVTPNVDHLVLAARSRDLVKIYRNASLSLADGQPVLWMARLLGAPLPEKVSGSDLLDPLMAMAARRGWRVFLFGASPAVSAQAEQNLCAAHPWLRIVGRDTSVWDPADEASSAAVIDAISRSGAELVVVALGAPRQERWMALHARALGPAVAIGLGGSLDFAAGAVRRAPRWMSRAGLEWLYRLSREPRRLAHRYLIRDTQIIPVFLAALVRRYLLGQPAVHYAPLAVTSSDT
jgi:N-acetylglucosaminyldiphosphoundecaprenol N-acetyl-beta-D-mannosaminyltransferase